MFEVDPLDLAALIILYREWRFYKILQHEWLKYTMIVTSDLASPTMRAEADMSFDLMRETSLAPLSPMKPGCFHRGSFVLFCLRQWLSLA